VAVLATAVIGSGQTIARMSVEGLGLGVVGESLHDADSTAAMTAALNSKSTKKRRFP